ncbi:hypothetical protein NGB36_22555 [Streptomyces sp. RB6PN25]|uniref:Secreted protein n=1 Tax=Streptomyces humicola TaxID=2953240 RepID=A0ABT1Q056_9ACTN|nr:hypothetical protein [Streptomyces humicola]MCQ4083310.1 hypothetical protein [Streptomyces humicola]
MSASAVGLATTAASAKSDIYFVAAPHNVHLGGEIRLTGNGDDDNFTFNRFCIQQRQGRGGWQTLRCSHGQYNGGGGLNMWIRAGRRGLVQFRGALVEGTSPTDKHPKTHLTSRVFEVDVN